jgi:hypothetical protein
MNVANSFQQSDVPDVVVGLNSDGSEYRLLTAAGSVYIESALVELIDNGFNLRLRRTHFHNHNHDNITPSRPVRTN